MDSKLVKIVFTRSKEILAFPIIRRFIEYRISIISMPDNILLIPSFLFNSAVATPAMNPDKVAIIIEKKIEFPFESKTANTAAPKVNEPSTVKSGKFIIRNEITIPYTANTYKKPC